MLVCVCAMGTYATEAGSSCVGSWACLLVAPGPPLEEPPGLNTTPTRLTQCTSFGASPKHSELGPELVGRVVCRSVGTVPGILGLVWLRFRPNSGSKSKTPVRILKSCRGSFSSAVPRHGTTEPRAWRHSHIRPEAVTKRTGALFCPSGPPRATTVNSALPRDWSWIGVPVWSKWAWRLKWGAHFHK